MTRSENPLLSQHAGRWNSPAEIKAEIADVPDRTLRQWLGELRDRIFIGHISANTTGVEVSRPYLGQCHRIPDV